MYIIEMDVELIQSSTTEQQINNDQLHPTTSIIKARADLIIALKEQLKAAEAMIAGKPYMITRMMWQTNDITGERVRVPIQVPLRKWYWRDAEGKVRFCLRVRNRCLELQNGKTNIVVGDDKELPAVVQACIAAAEAGELDDEIAKVVASKIQYLDGDVIS